jgi:serine/threonine protein kinase
MSPPLKLILLQPNGTPLHEPILGLGRTGVVVQRDGYAVKLPLKYRSAGPDKAPHEPYHADADITDESIEHEKEVYRRLGKHDGIVLCHDLSGVGIQMALMTYGNLRAYLQDNETTTSLQLTWFRDMARTLAYIHERHVIVADIATRNFLLDSQLCVKISDFTKSSILPATLDMRTVDDAGYSIFTDMGQLGAVMYEVITGQAGEFDLFKNQPPGYAVVTWPQRKDLPSTEGIWLGHVIEKCWTRGGLQDTGELVAELSSVTLD